MAKKNNRTCIICHKVYSYCPNCGEDADKPTWYFIFDGQNCHDIYEVVTAYRDEKIDVAEAYKEISKLDLSGLENFDDVTKEQINEILAHKEDKKTVKKADAKTE
jgi:hypothetical protein